MTTRREWERMLMNIVDATLTWYGSRSTLAQFIEPQEALMKAIEAAGAIEPSPMTPLFPDDPTNLAWWAEQARLEAAAKIQMEAAAKDMLDAAQRVEDVELQTRRAKLAAWEEDLARTFDAIQAHWDNDGGEYSEE